MSLESEAIRMGDHPAKFFNYSNHEAHHIPRAEADAMQLAGMRKRFDELRDQLPVLKKIAEEQAITGIGTLEHGAKLLFPHTVYKSYPVSLLMKNRFDHLTKWLDRLTTTDLSGIDVSHCDSIDSWFQTLESSADIQLVHSSGTSGTMTFLPRSKRDTDITCDLFGMTSRDFHGIDGVPDLEKDPWHTFYLGFAGGYAHAARAGSWALNNFAGSKEYFHTLYDIDMSADVMFLAARVRLAESRGELAALEVSPTMKARRAEFEAVKEHADRAMDRIFEQLLALKGEKVYIGGMSSVVADLSLRGLNLGHRHIFDPRSIIQCGGGNKGGTLANNWEQLIHDFTGADRVAEYYGMTEMVGFASKCSEGRYHLQPWNILYVLDPDTGRPLPREGVQTGRASFFDLVPQTIWGGFITGDEITADWTPCPCGRTTVHISPQVQRYSEKRGGDDKITCAASDDAHGAALDFLVSN